MSCNAIFFYLLTLFFPSTESKFILLSFMQEVAMKSQCIKILFIMRLKEYYQLFPGDFMPFEILM